MRPVRIALLLASILLIFPMTNMNIVIDASPTPLLPSTEASYGYGYCDTGVTPSTQNAAASEVETTMSNEGISQSLIPMIGAGTYVYKMVLTGGGGSASKSELGVCFDGIHPTDSVVKGDSDSTEIWRTGIGASTQSMFEFNGQGWVEDTESPSDTSVHVTLDSKWGSDMDTVLTWWLFTSTQINLRFDHPGSDNFDSMVVDEYEGSLCLHLGPRC